MNSEKLQAATNTPFSNTVGLIQTKRIRKIQLIHCRDACFATDKRRNCTEMCEWRRDCRKPNTTSTRLKLETFRKGNQATKPVAIEVTK